MDWAVGRQISRFRRERGLDPVDCARRCGFDAAYWMEVEDGRVVPDVATLEKIAEALDVPLPLLLTGAPAGSAAAEQEVGTPDPETLRLEIEMMRSYLYCLVDRAGGDLSHQDVERFSIILDGKISAYMAAVDRRNGHSRSVITKPRKKGGRGKTTAPISPTPASKAKD